MTARTRRTPKKRNWKPDFLNALAETGMVSEACKAARVGRSTVYEHRQADEDFALAWADVEEMSTEQLEREAVRRAKDGSDVLLIFLLKSRRPDRYRDNVKVEHSGTVKTAAPPVDAEERSRRAAGLLASVNAIPHANGNGNGHSGV